MLKFIRFSSPYSYTYSYTPISSPLLSLRIREIRVYEYVYEYGVVLVVHLGCLSGELRG